MKPTTQTTTRRPIEQFDCGDRSTCSGSPLDLSIVLDTSAKISAKQNTDQRRLAAEIIRDLEISRDSARITINPLNRKKKLFEIPFSAAASGNREQVCERLNSVDPTAIEYRGDQDRSSKLTLLKYERFERYSFRGF